MLSVGSFDIRGEWMASRRVAGVLVAIAVLCSGCGRTEPPNPPAGPAAQQRPRTRAEVLVSLEGVTVLKYEGSTLDAALAGGNKQSPSKLLADNVKIDEKQPLFGTLTARIDINEAEGAGGVSASGNAHESPVQLVLVRKSNDAVAWDLTPEAIAAIKRVKD
jgi:hypothetical protein